MMQGQSADGVLFDKSKKTLLTHPEGKTGDYEIPSTVTKISAFAFYANKKITEITIPD